VVNQAFALMLHCRAEGVGNLVAPLSYDLMKDDFVMEHLNLVALTLGGDDTVPALITTVLRKRFHRLQDGGRTASLCPEAVDDDEAALLDTLNVAFEALERGEMEESEALCLGLPEGVRERLMQLQELCQRVFPSDQKETKPSLA
jgi:hypothetical protein